MSTDENSGGVEKRTYVLDAVEAEAVEDLLRYAMYECDPALHRAALPFRNKLKRDRLLAPTKDQKAGA